MKRILVIILAALLTLFVALPAFAQGTELIENGDFEKISLADALPEGWIFHSYEGEYNGRTEVSSVSVEQDGDRGNVVHFVTLSNDDAALYQTVSVEPSSFYRLSCWVKTSGVEGGAGANIALRDIIAVSSGLYGDNDWTKLELVGKTGPSQTAMTVSCRLGGYSSVAHGEAWFDGFMMEKLESAEGSLIVPFYSGEVADDGGSDTSSLPIIFAIIGLVVIGIVGLAVIRIVTKKNAIEGELPPLESYADDKARNMQELSYLNSRSFFDMRGDAVPAPTELKLRLTKRDRIFVLVLTGVYALIALFRLGTLNFPTNSWSGNKGESSRIEFGREVKLTDIWQNSGLSHTNYKLVTDDGTEIMFSQQDGREYGHMFRWTSISKSTVQSAGATTGVTLYVLGGDSSRPKEKDLVMLELAFFDENGLVECTAEGEASALVDEQDTVPETPSYFNGMYFDELYHGRTALEHIQNLNVYEWTHPPLGKLIIALGILIFGMKPFGWRIMGVLFGIAMVPILYLMAKRLLKKSELALFSTFLFTFDFMHFTQTRIATVDVFAVFFILLMTYYMLVFISMDVGDDVRRMLKPLALSGIFFGLGCASKWICIYTGLGLALLFFVKLILLGVKSYRLNRNKELKRLELPKKYWRTFCVLALWCIVFFIVVPAVIYAASYFRYYTAQWKPAEQEKIYNADRSAYESAEDVKLGFADALTTYVEGVIKNQKDMFNYHSGLKSEHSASSTWWMWLLDLRPTWFYVGERSEVGSVKYVGTISAFGNPAVWIACTFAVFALIFILVFKIRKLPLEPWFVFVCLASSFLPWALVPRSTYAYHYFASVPYVSLLAGYLVGCVEEMKRTSPKEDKKKIGRGKYVWMAITLLLFGIFFPVISGLKVRQNYIYALQWVPYHKWEITETDEEGNETTKNYRIGWTFLSYEMSDPNDPDRYITRITK